MSESLSLCLACAALTAEHKSDVCPVCGEAIDLGRLERVRDVAGFIVRYGYHYRRYYEREGVESRALIDFEALWVFVGVAVLSGILGNSAYDLVQAAVRRIIMTYELQRPDRDTSPVRRLLIDEQAYNEFADCLDHYLRGMPGLDPAIRDAIAEEMLADELTREHMELLRKRGILEQLLSGASGLERSSGEEVAEAGRRANQVARERVEASFSSASYFVGLWSQVEQGGRATTSAVEPSAGADD